MLPSPLSPRAAIVLRSPEAESCRLTLTNTAQELRLSGCKLFSSSGETLPTPHGGGLCCSTRPRPSPPPGTAEQHPCCHHRPCRQLGEGSSWAAPDVHRARGCACTQGCVCVPRAVCVHPELCVCTPCAQCGRCPTHHTMASHLQGFAGAGDEAVSVALGSARS